MKALVHAVPAHGRPRRDRIISHTRSVCPHCLQVIDATYVGRGQAVFMDKQCAVHGAFSTLVWVGVEAFSRLIQAGAGQPCPTGPLSCAGCKAHMQKTCCVLLELTRRCNLSCPVCFADAASTPWADDPPPDTIAGWYDTLMAGGGPYNIQLSGGEPTLRDDLPHIIRLGMDKGFSFFQLNTNGLRLAGDPAYARSLAEAGLNTVFLQFDGVSDTVYATLRGRPLLEIKAAAIENCKQAGLGIVLVPTVAKGINDGELGGILDFAMAHSPHVRGIHFQPMSFFGRYPGVPRGGSRLTIPQLLKGLERQSSGRIKKSDFSPAGTEHPLCSFHADYRIDGDRLILQEGTVSGCCSVSSSQSRRVVARKWSAAPVWGEAYASDPDTRYNTESLDAFLARRARLEASTLAISGMAFQDAWNLDLDRLGRCYITQVGRDGAMAPFCAFNLTGLDTGSTYRQPAK